MKHGINRDLFRQSFHNRKNVAAKLQRNKMSPKRITRVTSGNILTIDTDERNP